MSLFNAPAWMMKGGAGGGATISTMSDDDPYNAGKTKVPLKLSNVKLKISDKQSRYILTFSVVNIGFTSLIENVPFLMELKSEGHWHYTSVLDTVNLTNSKQTKDISQQVNHSPKLRGLLTNPKNGNVNSKGQGKCYLLFQTSTEICDDQIRCEIETV